MSKEWENHEPSPIEFMHGRLMDEFHKWRIARTESINVKINGMEFNRITCAAKPNTYNHSLCPMLDNQQPCFFV